MVPATFAVGVAVVVDGRKAVLRDEILAILRGTPVSKPYARGRCAEAPISCRILT